MQRSVCYEERVELEGKALHYLVGDPRASRSGILGTSREEENQSQCALALWIRFSV